MSERRPLTAPDPIVRPRARTRLRVVLRRDLGGFDRPAPRPLPQRRGLGVLAPLAATVCVDTPAREFALTYDDGPDPAHTPALLDLLADRGVHATFFVLADAAAAHPDLLHRIINEGHELGLHGQDHRRLTRVPTRQALAQTAAAQRTVEQLSGAPLRLFRPPYGAHTPALLGGWRRLGLDVILWSGWAADWQDDPAPTIATRAAAAVHPGGILLLHDTRADADTLQPGERMPAFDRAEATALLVDALPGWTPRTVGDLIARHRPVRAVQRELWR
ncbi:polysaccharide deacetylase family protein [Cellulomonas sp. NPDC089187]|uniref:polysaccharide deacetylase family protein n=1 Tax=Cellulomonas sp. NPDC089187 TaxID=3154970 RepID=UPI003446B3A4